jgi:2-iminobutanoate/2-iminopropanoate deaminase
MDKELLIAPGQPSKKAKRVLIIVAVVAVAIWVAATVLLAISLKTTRNMVIVETDKAPAKLGPYNVAKAYDNLIFLSGQIGANPSNPTTGKLEGDITQQTAQAISNLKAVLAASNSTLD